MLDWAADNFGWVILAMVALTCWAGYEIVQQDTAAREEFMQECMKDHKKYECTAMWGNSHPQTTVVPVHTYVPMYHGR